MQLRRVAAIVSTCLVLTFPVGSTAQEIKKLEAQVHDALTKERDRDKAARLLVQLGDALKAQRSFSGAEERYAAAMLLLAGQIDAHHPAVTKLLEIQQHLGHNDTGSMLRLMAVASEKYLGDADEITASAEKNLGDYYASANQDNEAEAAYRRALEVAERAYGAQDPRVVAVLDPLSQLYVRQSRFADALPLFRRALSIVEQSFSSRHPDVGLYRQLISQAQTRLGQKVPGGALNATTPAAMTDGSATPSADLIADLDGKAKSYLAQKQFAQAEPLLLKALALIEQALGPEHPNALHYRQNVITVSKILGHFAEAERLCREALEQSEQRLGQDDPRLIGPLGQLAGLYGEIDQFAEAEQLYTRALRISEKNFGEGKNTALILSNLATDYIKQGRYREAEQAVMRALLIEENLFGKNDPKVSVDLGKLGSVYAAQGRFADAEPLQKRALDIALSQLGESHPSVAVRLSNLGALYLAEGRVDDAAPMFTRALSINEKAGGEETSDTAAVLLRLGLAETRQGRLGDAERHLKRALAIREKLGPDTQERAGYYSALADLYQQQGRMDEAEGYYKKALSMMVPGVSDHVGLSTAMSNLARLYISRERFADAYPLARQAYEINRAYLLELGSDSAGSQAERETKRWAFQDYISAIYHLQKSRSFDNKERGLNESFEAAQLAYFSKAGQQLARMTARFASGSDSLAAKIREREELAGRLQKTEERLFQLLSGEPLPQEKAVAQRVREEHERLVQRLALLDKELRAGFPQYAELLRGTPLNIGDAMKHLRSSEALMVYLVGEHQSYLFVVRPDKADLIQLDIGRAAIDSSVQLLRQRLDQDVREVDAIRPYDVAEALSLYDKIFSPAEPFLTGVTHVMLVQDGSLQSLPFSTLVSELPKKKIRTPEDHQNVAWLARRYVFTTLPSVSSLRALRTSSRRTLGNQSFVGFGDPQLEGRQGIERGKRSITMASLFGSRSPLADVDAIRQLEPLPDTATELKAIAKILRADKSALYLRNNATEATVKRTDLTKARVLAFSTHGAMAGELEGYTEPGLILSPPRAGTELDDGYLSASEIAQLKLNADWVLLSACNTAAADGRPGAEGLSGLAKAFFYAGARSLFVSHWSVDSLATRELITRMFSIYASNPEMGKSEALKQASLDLMSDKEHSYFAHPHFWAPFVIAGEGGKGGGSVLATSRR